MNESRINDRLKKIYALAMQGVDGEKETAKRLLDELMKKYSVPFEALEEEEHIDRYEFKYKSNDDATILIQVIVKVVDTNEHIYEYRGSNNRLLHSFWVDCALSEKLEIEFLFDFYKRLFQKVKERLLDAFIQKHELYASHPLGAASKKRSPEELEAIGKMMAALSDESPLKAITTREV